MNISKEIENINNEISVLKSKKKEIIKKINLLFREGYDEEVDKFFKELSRLDDEISIQGKTRDYLQSLH